MFCAIASPIISFFLWHLTWGCNQLVLHLFCLWFFLALVIPCRWLRAFGYSLVLHCITTAWLTFVIGFLMMFVCKIPVENQESYLLVYTEVQRITLSFAFFYNLCLFITAFLCHCLMPIPHIRLAVALIMSGITSALLIARFITFG